MTIAQWNGRTLFDRQATDRSERHTTLVAMELAKYNIDMLLFSMIKSVVKSLKVAVVEVAELTNRFHWILP